MSAGADEASCSGSLPNQSLMRTPGAVAVEELGLVTRRRIARRSTASHYCIGDKAEPMHATHTSI